MDTKLDGNASAGELQSIFPFEMTWATLTCGNCGDSNRVGETAVYMSGMGTVIRCPSCAHALIRIAHTKDRTLLDMQGSRVLRFSAEP